MSARSRRQSRTRSFGDRHVWAPDEHNASVRQRKQFRALALATRVAARRLGRLRHAFAGLSAATRATGIQ